MTKLAKLVILGFMAIGITACGKTGELTPVKAAKAEVVSAKSVPAASAPILIEPDIAPYNPK